MFASQQLHAARILVARCREKNLIITTAESCTGGLLSALITEIPGSSAIFERGYITYANDAKIELLDVDTSLIEKYGAVSSEVAQAMAEGVRKKTQADIAVAITGIAGPDGGSAQKPVGLVFIAVASKEKTIFSENRFSGNRSDIRMQAVAKALEMVSDGISSLRGASATRQSS